MATGGAEGTDKKKRNTNQQQTTDTTVSTPIKETDGKLDSVAAMGAYYGLIKIAPLIAEKIGKADLGSNPRVLIVDSLDIVSSEVPFLQIPGNFEFWETALHEQSKKIEKLMQQPAPPAVKKMEKPRVAAEVEAGAAAEAEAGAATEAKVTQLSALEPVTAAVKTIADATKTLADAGKTLADTFSYFDLEYDIQAQKVGVSNPAFQALIADGLAQKGMAIYWPAFHRLNSTSGLASDFAKLTKKRDDLKQKVSELRASLAGSAAIGTPQPVIKEEEQRKKEIETACKAAEECVKQFDAFVKDIVSEPQGSARSSLASALIAEYFAKGSITHLLYLSVITGSGERIIGKAKLREDTAGFLGACAVSYALADCDGKVVCAGTEYDSAGATAKLGHIDSLTFGKVKTRDGLIKKSLTWLKKTLWSSPEQ